MEPPRAAPLAHSTAAAKPLPGPPRRCAGGGPCRVSTDAEPRRGDKGRQLVAARSTAWPRIRGGGGPAEGGGGRRRRRGKERKPLQRLACLGQMLHGRHRLLEAAHRLPVGRSAHCLGARLTEVRKCLLPHLASHRMVGQPLDVLDSSTTARRRRGQGARLSEAPPGSRQRPRAGRRGGRAMAEEMAHRSASRCMAHSRMKGDNVLARGRPRAHGVRREYRLRTVEG